MISRRRFLEVGGVAGVAAASSPLVAAAQESGEAELPPSLAKLQSRKTKAPPITKKRRHSDYEKRTAGAPGTCPQVDERERAWRNRADGGHVAELLHRNSLVGRRAHVRAGATREGRGV